MSSAVLILAALVAATPGASRTALAPAAPDNLPPPPQSAFSCQDGSGLVARFALGKTLSRPSMSAMRASVDQPSLPNPALTPTQRFVSSGGNPELEPFRATALDLSVEKYFGNKGYISAAAFYKKIDTYVLTLPGF